jgi:hypothetical protein
VVPDSFDPQSLSNSLFVTRIESVVCLIVFSKFVSYKTYKNPWRKFDSFDGWELCFDHFIISVFDRLVISRMTLTITTMTLRHLRLQLPLRIVKPMTTTLAFAVAANLGRTQIWPTSVAGRNHVSEMIYQGCPYVPYFISFNLFFY